MEDSFWTIVAVVAWALVAFYAGVAYREWLLLRDIKRVLGNLSNVQLKAVEDQLQEVEGKINKAIGTVKPVATLKHEVISGGHYFFYEDDQFACQGATLEEAAANFSKATNNEEVGEFVNASDKRTYYFVEGRIHGAETVQ